MISFFLILGIFWTATSECRSLDNEIKLAIVQAAYDGVKMADDLIGLSDNYFYSIQDKQQAGAVYNQDIELQITSINKKISSLTPHASRSADVISNTLLRLNEAINQLIVDSSSNSPSSVIIEDNKQIQEVVKSFKESFSKTVENEEQVHKAIHLAEGYLRDFVFNMEKYIRELNLLVYQSNDANIKLLRSNTHLVAYLRKFVEASALATYFGNL